MIKNQEKLGITGSQGNKQFYNEFIHNILSNGQDIQNEDRVAQCLAKIDIVAIVTINKPDNEVIVITKSKRMLTSVASKALEDLDGSDGGIAKAAETLKIGLSAAQ